jgi:hypothetical protein
VAGPGENLTGVRQGLFTYPRFFRAGNFSATLIETASYLSGSTSELYPFAPRKGETILAMLSGHRSGASVRFTKTYEGPEKPDHSVEYEGTLTDDFLEIEGRWIIPGNWAGRFLMIRSGGRSVEVAREEFERVGR